MTHPTIPLSRPDPDDSPACARCVRFLVTPEGVIATDPINAEAAAWLEAEIDKRFGRPIRYLVLSHDHADHSSGGEVFADTAAVIAHDRAKATIIGERRPTAVPDITFSDRMTLELGGKQVELIHVGRNHSDNSRITASISASSRGVAQGGTASPRKGSKARRDMTSRAW